MIIIKNVELIELQDFEIGNVKASKKEMAMLNPDRLGTIPIILQMGKVRYRIGDINKVYVGGNAITGDLLLQLKGHLEMGVKDNNIRPEAYVFKVEKT